MAGPSINLNGTDTLNLNLTGTVSASVPSHGTIEIDQTITAANIANVADVTVSNTFGPVQKFTSGLQFGSGTTLGLLSTAPGTVLFGASISGTFFGAGLQVAGSTSTLGLQGTTTEIDTLSVTTVGGTIYRGVTTLETVAANFLDPSNTVEYQFGANKSPGSAIPPATVAVGDVTIALKLPTVFGSTVTLHADPTTNLQAATKQYVDSHVGGIAAKGRATLVAGTVTVSSASASASAVILLTNGAPSAAIGALSVGAIVAGTSFVINSTSNLDTSTINWAILS